MNDKQRKRFDRELQWVLERLPPEVHELLETIPLHVEDEPTPEVMRELGVEFPDELCGYYTGVPIDERSVDGPPGIGPPELIYLYREGILAMARDQDGRVTTEAVREEIRITILHELGHHHGIDEDELDELGYG